jgi:hypothetical protein
MLIVAFLNCIGAGELPKEQSNEIVVTQLTGLLEFVDLYRRQMTIRSNGQLEVFDVLEKARITVNGETIVLEDFESVDLGEDSTTTIRIFPGSKRITEVDVRIKPGRPWRVRREEYGFSSGGATD